MKKTEYIPIEDCVDGDLYLIDSRNLSMGVFYERGFIGIRLKFYDRFLFIEDHWDTGEPHGTVKPIKFLESCPIENLDEHRNPELFQWLEQKEREYDDDGNPRDNCD